MRSKIAWARMVLGIGLAAVVTGASAAPVTLAEGGQSGLPVVTTPGATPRTVAAARELSEMLGRITGAEHHLGEGDGASGIAVGTAADIPALAGGHFDSADMFRREEYLIRTHPGGVHLVGATDLAVEHAVWDFLHHLGFRQFFPGEIWEIVPRLDKPTLDLDVLVKPAFLARTIGKGGDWRTWQRKNWDQWERRNRMVSGLSLRTSHQYQAIRSAKDAVFREHPEYLGLVGDVRYSTKFCISNPGLRQVVVDFAIEYFTRDPEAESISMEPSDGGNWCQCEPCGALGSISDRAVILANAVAEAVTARFGRRIVGLSAYNEHAPVPSLRLHSNVWVSVATHQRKGSETFDELMEGWRRQGAGALGAGEAYGTRVWDFYLPGRPRGSSIPYLRTSIPHYHELGARRVGGWTEDAWGPVGLGNYIVSRLLWDLGEARQTGAIIDDFLTRCFPASRAPMERLYRLLYQFDDNEPRPLISEDLLGRMYRTLDEALALASDPAERARISALVLYTRFVELHLACERADPTPLPPRAADPKTLFAEPAPELSLDENPPPSPATVGEPHSDRQRVFRDLIRHAYRTHRTTHMIDSNYLFSDAPDVFASCGLPKGVGRFTSEAEDPWKDGRPFTDAEVAAIISAGIASNPALAFATVSYSGNLVPAPALAAGRDVGAAPDKRFHGYDGHAGAVHVIHTWVAQAPAAITLQVTGGLAARNKGNVDIRLFSPVALGEGGAPEPVALDKSVPPDGVEREIVLRTPHQGHHWIEVRSAGDRSRVRFADPLMAHTVESGFERPRFSVIQDWSLCFYVPQGTTVVGGHSDNLHGALYDSTGKSVFDFSGMEHPGNYSVPVPEGQDGKVWWLKQCRGRQVLMTVPPYLAPSPAELLLPAEVVARDGLGSKTD